jgi:hypothetical protein
MRRILDWRKTGLASDWCYEQMNIDHIQMAIPVGGEDAARLFYGDIVGLAEIPKPTELALRGGCWFAADNMQLHLGIDPDFHPGKKSACCVAHG